MENTINEYSSEILSDKFLSSYINKTVPWGFNGLGYIVYKRTYARKLKNGQTEEWWQTVARCINGAQKIGAQYTKEEAEELFNLIFNLKCSFAGRMLWQLGTSTVDRFGANSLLNCFAKETKVLTRQGWKEIYELENKNIEIVTKYGKWVTAFFKSYGEQKLLKITYSNSNGSEKWDVFATEGHKWLLLDKKNTGRTECLTSELKTGDKLPIVRGKNSSQYLSPQGIQHGLVFGDGSCNGYESFIDLINEKYDYFNKYFYLNRISWTNPENNKHVRFGGFPNLFKNFPDINENKPYLMGFLAGWIAADGSVNKTDGSIRLFSAEKENLLLAKDIASVCGFRTTKPYLERDKNPFNGEDSESWSIRFNLNDNPEFLIIRDDHKSKLADRKECDNFAKVISIEKTDRIEKVYCCEVPGTHCFVIDGNVLTGNCWFTRIAKPSDFCFLFENLMLGGGVGFSIRREDVHELPRIKKGVKISIKNTKDADFICPDSRQGWIKLLEKVLDAYFHTGKSFNYSTILIRGAGEPINGFGGTASGPLILEEGIEKICSIINKREGKKLRSIDCLDICNIIGSIVVAGNIRRSALIALGDPDDILYLKAKRWDLGDIPNWRAMSNNTIYADEYDHIMENVWDGYAGNGEPYGFFNLDLSQEYGRLGEKRKDGAIGLNPCGEIVLQDKECCNLSEIFLNNVESKDELIRCSKLLYKTQKAICALPFIHEETEKIVHKNFRLGQSVTGICQSLDKIEWLDDCYKELRKFDKIWSKEREWPESIKLTTNKPSGSISILAGSTPGVHPAYSDYYIRRIRISSNDVLINICKKLGFHVEFAQNFDETIDRNTCVVSFPCECTNAILAKNISAVEQLEIIKKMQTVWADNAVSCTVYYKKEELQKIKEWLKSNYEKSVKSVSFLLHSDHGFKQAPYEEIMKDMYDTMIKNIKSINTIKIEDFGLQSIDGLECANGVCPIK